MKTHIPRVVIAGLRGGSGKTTLSIGITAALIEKGLKVTAFKKGPDYIDSGWLSAASGRPCYNLDPFLVGEEHILSSFAEHAFGSDCALVEGNRGVFDGVDSEGTYSTARLAHIIKSPLILVVDCTKITNTMAAIIMGVKQYDPRLSLAGVVLNEVSGKRHETVIRRGIESALDVPVLGAIPRDRKLGIRERHMGLTPRDEHKAVRETIRRAAKVVSAGVSMDRVIEIARMAGPLAFKPRTAVATDLTRVTIGVMRDSAFQFYYEENIEELKRRGARVVQTSALKGGLPKGLDALYIGGGFPETHAVRLSENLEFIRSLKKAVEAGLPVYAECGGLMYLGRSLRIDGRSRRMAGILPVSFDLDKRPQAHGYTVVKVDGDNPFYEKGTELKGHEFHYSRVVSLGQKKGVHMCLKMKRGEGISEKRDGLCYKNVFATYTHLHALGSPEWAEGMINAAQVYRTSRRS